jgi:hypothetical protein
VFQDPAVRRAYLLTKLAVVSVAAVVSWPLSRVVGPQVWLGYGAFVAIMALITVAVLLVPSRGDAVRRSSDPGAEEAVPDPEDPVRIPVEDALDLHPFTPRDIPAVVEDYLEEAHARGLREVRLIHGRGLGVQRERVRSVLGRHPLVESFEDATPDRGGWGATIARLRDS